MHRKCFATAFIFRIQITGVITGMIAIISIKLLILGYVKTSLTLTLYIAMNVSDVQVIIIS